MGVQLKNGLQLNLHSKTDLFEKEQLDLQTGTKLEKEVLNKMTFLIQKDDIASYSFTIA